MSDDKATHLQHHFDTPEQQYASGKLGMWLFLATEILLFGGLFCAYAIYRANHPEIFIYAHQFLDKTWGAINTVILIGSSFTMAWAVRCAQRGKQKALVVLLCLTFLGACGFLGVKYVEYKAKWEHGLLWGQYYAPTHAELGESAHNLEASGEGHAAESLTGADAHPAPVSEAPEKVAPEDEKSKITLAPRGPAGLAPVHVEEDAPENTLDSHGPPVGDEPRNVQLFFSIYFLMTGLHGIHVIAGMCVIMWLIIRSIRGDFNGDYYTPVDLGGLYWHLVDLIWIYLFPLLYLIG